MNCYNLNMYNSNSTIDINYKDILELPVRYPQYVIQRPLSNEYLFYHVPGKQFYNYFKADKQ